MNMVLDASEKSRVIQEIIPHFKDRAALSKSGGGADLMELKNVCWATECLIQARQEEKSPVIVRGIVERIDQKTKKRSFYMQAYPEAKQEELYIQNEIKNVMEKQIPTFYVINDGHHFTGMMLVPKIDSIEIWHFNSMEEPDENPVIEKSFDQLDKFLSRQPLTAENKKILKERLEKGPVSFEDFQAFFIDCPEVLEAFIKQEDPSGRGKEKFTITYGENPNKYTGVSIVAQFDQVAQEYMLEKKECKEEIPEKVEKTVKVFEIYTKIQYGNNCGPCTAAVLAEAFMYYKNAEKKKERIDNVVFQNLFTNEWLKKAGIPQHEQILAYLKKIGEQIEKSAGIETPAEPISKQKKEPPKPILLSTPPSEVVITLYNAKQEDVFERHNPQQHTPHARQSHMIQAVTMGMGGSLLLIAPIAFYTLSILSGIICFSLSSSILLWNAVFFLKERKKSHTDPPVVSSGSFFLRSGPQAVAHGQDVAYSGPMDQRDPRVR